ncbi:nuclear transport factor 2 family protein [Polyangium spumosum]|uniref:DUF4440 domain-containing protein n=1 Tax=Polyangium spumosum TaxID=889282 RepID=A0A6N7PKB3_9BACT|nr:nuclear transport factor 2 family protein [Polyangium spumosum]MRG92458.1 DUF4440 domain-containing protein [Polyangium spumosum]
MPHRWSPRQSLLLCLLAAGCAAAPPPASAPCPEPPPALGHSLPTEAELSAEHERLVKAYRTNDVPALERSLAPDHVHNNVFGMIQGKEELLADMRAGTLVFRAYEITSSSWSLKPDIAVVTGTLRAEAERAGKPVPSQDFRFTRIFVKREGVWLEWLFHNTIIAAPRK